MGPWTLRGVHPGGLPGIVAHEQRQFYAVPYSHFLEDAGKLVAHTLLFDAEFARDLAVRLRKDLVVHTRDGGLEAWESPSVTAAGSGRSGL